jgi:hypothetical protein
MKNQSIALRWLIPLIGTLAFIAASAGLFYQTSGEPFEFDTLRGETVMINGRGLYRYDTVSAAAQEQGQDAVTLLLALPVLAFSTWLAFRGSLRGRLLLTGTLGYFLYTYTAMVFLSAYNALFLIYVALFSLSLYTFILSMMSFDLTTLTGHFSQRLPRRIIAGVLFAVGGFLLIAWLGRIVPPLLQNQPPEGLESTTTLVIQAMDLGILVPLSILSGILLLRGSAWGYLLASIAVMKYLTFGVAVSAMGINMMLAGVEGVEGLLVVFMVLTLLNAAIGVLILRHIDVREKKLIPASQPH